MSDYELQMKIKNAPMLNRMRAMGIGTAAEMSKASGVAETQIGKMLNLKISMLDTRAKVRSFVAKIADTLVCHPEELFPEQHWHSALEKNYFEGQVAADQLQAIASQDPLDILLAIEHKPDFDKMVSGGYLNAREKATLKKRYVDGEYLEKIAAEYGVTRERIRQIEGGAIRKLRHTDALKQALEHSGEAGQEIASRYEEVIE